MSNYSPIHHTHPPPARPPHRRTWLWTSGPDIHTNHHTTAHVCHESIMSVVRPLHPVKVGAGFRSCKPGLAGGELAIFYIFQRDTADRVFANRVVLAVPSEVGGVEVLAPRVDAHAFDVGAEAGQFAFTLGCLRADFILLTGLRECGEEMSGWICVWT